MDGVTRSDQPALGSCGNAEALLSEAAALERAGRTDEAVRCYEAAASAAERVGAGPTLAGALRRLAVLLHQRGDADAALACCLRSVAVARNLGDGHLAAEALNTLGGLYLSTGRLEEARDTFLSVLATGEVRPELGARVEQNLGILSNIQGNLEEAVDRYRRSLRAYRRAGDERGCGIAYNNLGMARCDAGDLDEAEGCYRMAQEIAGRVGDVHLLALSLVNHAEVDVTRQRYENARQRCDEALAMFERLGARGARADCYRVLGVVYRETGRAQLAEGHLREAIDIAVVTGSLLAEAEGTHELAVLYLSAGRNQDALRLLERAHRMFRRLDARMDLVHVGGRMAALQATYLAVARAWGRSIEATDPTTFGHCERVAQTAVAVARVLGLSEEEETAVLLGAYLHDLGMLRIPREVLMRPAPLSAGDMAVLQTHPLRGIDLLADVEFPWEIKPIVRWHHERCDGSGYPDGLRGDEIPLGAQIVGIAEAHDAMMSPRGAGPALTAAETRARLARSRGHWSARVVDAYLRVTAPS